MATLPDGQKKIMQEKRLQGVVDTFRSYIQQQGWSIVNEKTIQNGLQLLVTDGLTQIFIDCYTNGNALIQGPSGSLQTDLRTWWKQLKASSTPPLLLEANIPPSVHTKVETFRSFGLSQGWSVTGKTIHNGIYQLRFTSGNAAVPINFYPTGTVLIQGNPNEMKSRLESWWKHQQNQHYASTLWGTTISDIEASTEHKLVFPSVTVSAEKPVAPHIGMNEAGKDNYFGPLIIAGVYIDKHTEGQLIELGVRDSELLPDNIIISLAEEIKKICHGQGHILSYRPERYNKMYQEMSNIDLLRAKAHVQVVTNLQNRLLCHYAVIDRFTDESLIPNLLQEVGSQITLEQREDGFDDISVTSAYIIARAEFVQQLLEISKHVGVELLAGGEDSDLIKVGRKVVAGGGQEALGKVAKLHFKITQQILHQ